MGAMISYTFPFPFTWVSVVFQGKEIGDKQ